MHSVTALVFVAAFLPSLLAINPTTVADMEIEDLPQKVDMAWVGAQTVWYYPIIHALEAYYFAVDSYNATFALAHTFQELSDMGCNYWQPLNSATFFGHTNTYDVAITDREVIYRISCTAPGIWRNYVYELTDNETFVLGVVHHTDGKAGWILLATTPTLPVAVENRIKNRILSLGFTAATIRKPTDNAALCAGIPA